MKLKKLMNKWLLIAVAGMLSLAFTGCESNDDNKTFIYTIGMENYQYTGSSLLGPLSYLSSLNLSEGVHHYGSQSDGSQRRSHYTLQCRDGQN